MEHLKHGLQGGGLVPQASLDSAAPTRGQADGGDLARRSAPAPGLCLSSPNTQRNLGPSAHGPIHAPSGRGFASPLPTSAEVRCTHTKEGCTHRQTTACLTLCRSSRAVCGGCLTQAIQVRGHPWDGVYRGTRLHGMCAGLSHEGISRRWLQTRKDYASRRTA